MKTKYNNYTRLANCRVFDIRAGDTQSNYYNFKGSWDSAVGIKTGYGLDGSGAQPASYPMGISGTYLRV